MQELRLRKRSAKQSAVDALQKLPVELKEAWAGKEKILGDLCNLEFFNY